MGKTEITTCPLCDKFVHEHEEAILCEGGCSTWYHRDCLGMMLDHYEKITNGEKGYEIWLCPHCEIPENMKVDLTSPQIGGQLRTLNKLSYSFPKLSDRSLDALKLELSQVDNVTDETDNTYSLRMAGEIGKALLEENQHLKSDIISYKNCILTKDIEIEDLQSQNVRLHTRVQELLNIIEEINKQSDRIREEMVKKTQYYEEHDFEQLKVIDKHEKEIIQLKRAICKQDTHTRDETTGDDTPKKRDHTIDSPNSNPQDIPNEISLISKNINNLSNYYKMLEKRIANLEVNSALSVPEKIKEAKCSHIPTSNLPIPTNKKVQRMPPHTAKLLQSGETYEDFFNNNIQDFLRNQDDQLGKQLNNDLSTYPPSFDEGDVIKRNNRNSLDEAPADLPSTVSNGLGTQQSFLEEPLKTREKWKMSTRKRKGSRTIIKSQKD